MDSPAAEQARNADAALLARLLQDSRRDTLATFDRYQAALGPGLPVPLRPELNPPLWELGHIGWFQSWWVGRFPARAQGVAADPDGPRSPPARAGADALYDSSRVPHDSRWHLPLPDAAATRADLAAQLDETLRLLQRADGDDAALYMYRLALFHEDMHHEAAVYMAQGLDIELGDARWQPRPLPEPPPPLRLAAATHRLGHAGPGFAFDNECGRLEVALAPFTIDAQALRWAEFLPFVDAGGYADDRLWTEAGRAWRGPRRAPARLQREGGQWLQRRAGRWQALDLALPACNLSAHEAQAWCRWAGRRLPTEAEWEHAALTHPHAFRWGDVWEWTSSPFQPWPGFVAHPYRDYSQPWFDGRPVLRGGSWGTQPRMKHPRYRNYFTADRCDILAGLRSCALE